MTDLENKLAEVNGSRRTRTLSLDDICNEAHELKSGQHSFLHGGTVNSSYNYPAFATVAVVFKPRRCRNARVYLRKIGATKGGTGFGQEKHWSEPEDWKTYSLKVPAITGNEDKVT